MRTLPISLLVVLSLSNAFAEAPRVLPKGEKPKDARLAGPRILGSYFPFTPPKTVEEWKTRSEELRRQVLVANGLWPMPEKTPLNAVVHGKVDRDDYTVERVFFESLPGFFVTGSLYRPKGKEGKLPVVLGPHGHWNNGRFHDAGEKETRRLISIGAERFEESGRYSLQARCVQLARMGCVVFHYDMLGNADSQQISYPIAHGAKGRPAKPDSAESWTLFSAQAEMRLQSIMGLQTWNSVRALDFVCDLPDVDPARIAVTGASGGGTQTFLLGAVDDRPAILFPAVMVSTGMQGGCTCENCSLLRIGAGNVDFAALAAPRPLGMTSANDWTRELETKGFPELKALYELLGVSDKVALFPFNHFGHNYNAVSRSAMYGFLNKHLNLGFEEPIIERDFNPLTIAEMTVWNEEHPKPEAGEAFERKLLKQMAEASDKQFEDLEGPVDVFYLLEVVVEWGRWEGNESKYVRSEDHGDYREDFVIVGPKSDGPALPTIVLTPKKATGAKLLWVSGAGKQALYGDDGKPRPEIKRLLEKGTTVYAGDLFKQGEFLDSATEKVTNVKAYPGHAPGYTYGYNKSIAAQRIADILTLIDFAHGKNNNFTKLDLAATEGMGVLAVIAYGLAPGGNLAIDTEGFRFADINDAYDEYFLPGAVKVGDVPGLLNALGVMMGFARPAPDFLILGEDGDIDDEHLYGKIVDWLLKPRQP